MDECDWEQPQPWTALRRELPVGPLFCVIKGPTRGPTVVQRRCPARTCAGPPRWLVCGGASRLISSAMRTQ